MFYFWQFYKDYKKDKEELAELRKSIKELKEILDIKTEWTLEKQSKNTNVQHTRKIIDGKLYDTEKSDRICNCGMKSALFKTKSGNYFRCAVTLPYYYENKDFLSDIIQPVKNKRVIYHSITPITEEEVKNYLGCWDVEKYIELFGEVEEA